MLTAGIQTCLESCGAGTTSIRQSAGISNKVEVLRVCQSTCLLDYDSAQVCHGYLSKQHRAVSLKSHFPTSAENAKIRQHCEVHIDTGPFWVHGGKPKCQAFPADGHHPAWQVLETGEDSMEEATFLSILLSSHGKVLPGISEVRILQ